MKRIAVILHLERLEAAATAAWIADAARARGIEVYALASDAARVGSPSLIAVEDLPEDLELVVVLGGDGTLLRAADLTAGLGAPPLLGVNFGHLGFLSELERSDLEPGLQRVLDDGFLVEERMVLAGQIEEGESVTSLRALNEVIVAKTEIGRAIKLSLSIAGEPLVSWAADGVIVATPTGSTAYSLSVGGPVISPRIDGIAITPVAPHGLFDRTVIAAPDEEVVVQVLPDADAAALSADGGPAVPVGTGAIVRLRASDERLRLAKVAPAPFWRLVRDKFDLRGRSS